MGRVALRMALCSLEAFVATVVSVMAIARGMSFFWMAQSKAASERSKGTAFLGLLGQGSLYRMGEESWMGLGLCA